MRVVAVTDFAALGYKVLLAMGIEVQGRPAEEVGSELAQLAEVFAVHLVTGARDWRSSWCCTTWRNWRAFCCGDRQDPRHTHAVRRDSRRHHQIRLRLGADRMKNPLPTLDALDRRIVEILTVDARVSNRQIAAQLGVTEGTIRGRINRLEEGGAIRLTAVTNVQFVGSPKTVLIGIQAHHGELGRCARRSRRCRRSVA